MDYNIEEVKWVLKSEFIGLDHIIDKVVNMIDTYLKIKDTLTRPLVVNLWGMTGYGKTSLVKRTVSLMKLNNLYMNVSNIKSENSFNYGFDEVLEFSNSDSKVIIFDEFHQMRSRDDMGGNIDISDGAKMVWNILDNGIFGTDESSMRHLRKVKHYVKLLKYIKQFEEELTYGVEGINRVYFYGKKERLKNIADVCDELTIDYGSPHVRLIDNDTESKLVVRIDYDYVYSIMVNNTKDKGSIQQFIDFDQKCKQIDDLISLYEKVIENGEDSFKIDVSKSIIFNLGNLDEVYGVTDEHYTDLSADECADIIEEVTNTEVNVALSHLFRPEHLSRLGTNNIIYPVYREDTFKTIVGKYLDERVSKTKELGLEIKLDESVYQWVLKNNTYITLGVRNIINSSESLIMDIIAFCLTNQLNGIVNVSYGVDEVLTINGTPTNIIKKKNKISNNEKALTAVHETGHFLLYYLLTGKKPAQVNCVTDLDGANGFMKPRNKDRKRYSNWCSIKNDVSVLLAGICAERQVFGKYKTSIGGSSDIEKATKKISYIIRDCGFDFNEQGELRQSIINGLNTNSAFREDGKYGIVNNTNDDIIQNVIQCCFEYTEHIISDSDITQLLVDISKKLFHKEKFTNRDIDEICDGIPEDIKRRYYTGEDDYFNVLFG